MDSDSVSMQAAMEAMTAEVKRQVLEPGYKAHLAPELRTRLVEHAERTFAPAEVDPEAINRLLVQRIAARSIAGTLGMLDGAGGKSPFKNPELTKVYDDEKNFRIALEAQSERFAQNGLSH